MNMDDLAEAIDLFAQLCYDAAATKGFHENDDLSTRIKRALVMDSSRDQVAEMLVRDLGKQWTDLEVSKRLMLAVGELVEAQEELRAGFGVNEVYFRCVRCEKVCRLTSDGRSHCCDRPAKPEGVPIEIADALIRLGDLVGMHSIPLGRAITMKLAFNRSRAHKHGKQF